VDNNKESALVGVVLCIYCKMHDGNDIKFICEDRYILLDCEKLKYLFSNILLMLECSLN
jgi:hypothetical protein